MSQPPPLIWIQDAAKEYGRSRQWLDQQVQDGVLSVAHVPGDRRVYLVRAELDALLKPQIRRAGEDVTDVG